MIEATQPRMARGTKLSIGLLVTALFALLAFAPFASATPDPLASGKTTVTFKQGFVKSLKKHDVKILKISPATLKGKKATFPVNGGELDPTNGMGVITHSGGLKFKHEKKKAPVKAITIDTTKKALFAKVGGKKVKFATLGGLSWVRNGFGVNLTVKKLTITNAAAKQLNKKLGLKKHDKAFFGNRVIGSAKSETQPATVTIVPGGNVSFNADQQLLLKLKDVETEASLIAPTTSKGLGNYEFPITGGAIAPDATSGVVQTSGGVKLFQKLPKSATEFLETEITLGNFYVDLTAKTVSVEVVAKSNASEKLNLGNLGRSSIADLTLTGATVTTDATNRTVSIQNAGATLQPISAEVLEGFVKVYEGWYSGVLQSKGLSKEEADKKAAEKVEKDHIAAGESLGTFSFTAQTQ